MMGVIYLTGLLLVWLVQIVFHQLKEEDFINFYKFIAYSITGQVLYSVHSVT